jgi:CYTH domain-containing protein
MEGTLFLAENNPLTGKKQLELEYSFMAKLTDMNQLKKADSNETYEQWMLMSSDLEKGGSIRVRNINDKEFVLTIKNHRKKIKGVGNADETEMKCTKDMFESFKKLANFGSKKERYKFKIPNKNYYWEVDVYLKADGKRWEWVKLDLELPNVISDLPPFPMNFEKVISNQSKNPGDEKFIKELFKNNKITLINDDNIMPLREYEDGGMK